MGPATEGWIPILMYGYRAVAYDTDHDVFKAGRGPLTRPLEGPAGTLSQEPSGALLGELYPERVSTVPVEPLRPLRAVRNDRAILTAAQRLAADEGWTGLLFPRIAADAGLSIRPLHERYPSREALAADLWTRQLAADIIDLLGRAAATPTGRADMTDLLTACTAPTEAQRAASELLMVVPFSPMVAASVDTTLGEHLTTWLTPRGNSPSRAIAAQRAYLIALTLGMHILARRYPQRAVTLTDFTSTLAGALAAGDKPQRVPADRADHLDGPVAFGTDDPIAERLLTATLDAVAEVGYDQATVDEISRRAGFTKGALFRRYSTKRDLFLDATRRMSASTMEANLAFEHRIESATTPGIASAVAIREFMRPGRERARAVFLEQTRLAIHDPQVRAVIDAELSEVLAAEAQAHSSAGLVHIHTAQALALGIVQLQVLHPSTWELPFDVVTVPLLDHH